MKKEIVLSEWSGDLPNFFICEDSNGDEYVVHTGKFPCIIKFVDYEWDSPREDEEDDDDESSSKRVGKELEGQFHLQVLKFTAQGLKPLGYEKDTKVVKQILAEAITFFLSLEEENE